MNTDGLEVYQYPLGSPEYAQAREDKIESIIRGDEEKKKAYSKYLVCFPTPINSSYDSVVELNNYYFIGTLNELKGLVEIGSTDIYDTPIEHFKDTITFPESKIFSYVIRSSAEFNPRIKQLVVCAYITDGKSVIFLNNKSGGREHMKGKLTFIQGHVEYDPYIYLMSQLDFLKRNMERELSEELNMDSLDEKLIVPNKPKFYISTRENHAGLEHLGIIYEIVVDDAFTVAEKLSSGEKDKHSIFCDTIAGLKSNELLDNWLVYVVDQLYEDLQQHRRGFITGGPLDEYPRRF